MVAVIGGAAGTVAASAAAADSAASVARGGAAAAGGRDGAAAFGTGAGRPAADRARCRRDRRLRCSRRYRRRSPSSASCSDRWPTAFAGARRPSGILYGFARHEMTHDSSRLLHRSAPALGAAHRSAGGQREIRRPAAVGVGRAVDRGLRRGRRRRRRRRLWPTGWTGRAGTIDLPPGRYDTVLPPTAVADFMLPLAWSAGARPAHEGRSAFSAPGGGTRLGERLTDRRFTLFSDPAAAGSGVHAVRRHRPFRGRGLGFRQRRTDRPARPADRRGDRQPAAHPGLGRRVRRAVHPVTDNLLLTGGETGPHHRRSGRRRRSGVCWSPRSGTCARSTR